MADLRDELELRRKTEIHEVEEVCHTPPYTPLSPEYTSSLSFPISSSTSLLFPLPLSLTLSLSVSPSHSPAEEWPDQHSDEKPRKGFQ